MKRARPVLPVKCLPDGRAMINLGCSARVAPGWNNVDFSWLLRLSRYRRLSSGLHRLGLMSQARYERLQKLDPDVVVWDLRRGIPFDDQTFEVVYHSHMLEHIDREDAPGFLHECYRVLKTGGILRVVVPDLEQLARHYVAAINGPLDEDRLAERALVVEEMFDQMVRRTPKVRKEQKPIVRLIESVLVGNTDRAGILHRWMYDRFSLEQLMREIGFVEIQCHDEATSQIESWRGFNLDTEPDGSSYKPGSLYMEGRRT